MTKFIGIIVLLALTACAQQSEKPNVDLKAEELAIRSISMKWLELGKNRDVDGIAALFTDDGTLFRQNQEPVVGIPAIKDLIRKDFELNPKLVPGWSTDKVEISSSGDMAIEYGSFNDTNRGPDGTVNDQGKYITLYRKVNGDWKVIADISVSTKPLESVK